MMTGGKIARTAAALALIFCLAAASPGRAADEWGNPDGGYQAEEYFPEEFADEGGPQQPLDLESANTSFTEAENLFEKQQYVTAAELAQLAAGHFEALAQTEPDLYRPRQMAALVLQVRSLRRSGELDEAQKAAGALLTRLKPLAGREVTVYLPFLADVNHELAEIIYDRKTPDSRAARMHECRRAAAGAYRELALKNPDEYWAAWEDELLLMLLDSREFGMDGEKPKILTELIRANRWMARERPQSHRPELAQSLVAHGEELALAGQPAAGREAIEEGITIYRQLEAVTPGGFAKELSDAEYILKTLP